MEEQHEHEIDPETATERPEPDAEPEQDAPDPDDAPDAAESESGDTFPRDYVEQLRRKSSGYRLRAQKAEETAEQLGRELYRLRVESLGILADPDDLPFDADMLGDTERLREAAEQLVQERPHLRARRAAGNIGQHEHGRSGEDFSLMGALRAGL